MPEPEPLELDRAAILERVGDDEELLREVVQLFFDDSSRLTAELRQALADGNAAALERPAHSLKGSAGLFGAPAVVEAAQKLESLGRAGELAGAAEVYARLQQELDRLKPALSALVAS